MIIRLYFLFFLSISNIYLFAQKILLYEGSPVLISNPPLIEKRIDLMPLDSFSKKNKLYKSSIYSARILKNKFQEELSELTILGGIDSSGRYYCFFDLNHNSKFEENEGFIFPSTYKLSVDELYKLKANTGWHKITPKKSLSFFIKVIPWTFNDFYKRYPNKIKLDSTEVSLYACYSMQGKAKIKDDIYFFNVISEKPFRYFKNNSNIKLAVSQSNNQNSNHIYEYEKDDTVYLRDGRYKWHITNNNELILKKINYVGKKYGNAVNEYIKNYQLTDNNGNMAYILDSSSKYTLIDFWYTTCPPCLELLPYIDTFQKINNSNNVRCISIAYDSKDKLDLFFSSRKKPIKYFYINPTVKNNPILSELQVTSFPLFFLINENGKIIYRGSSINEFSKMQCLLTD